MSDISARPPQNYVRPDELQPAGPNPFDNGTAEPAPVLGQPNGTPLEAIQAMTPPAVYEKPGQTPDAVTAKASLEDRAVHDRAVVEAEDLAAQQLQEAAELATPAGAEAARAAQSDQTAQGDPAPEPLTGFGTAQGEPEAPTPPEPQA